MHKPLCLLYFTTTYTITVARMSCEYCEETVEDALGSLAGVDKTVADHEPAVVDVAGSAPTDDLLTAVEDAGYGPSA
ncbi:MAG: copper chaperone [Halonotius sp. J07HN6]|jgi:Copper chaperone|nr:MAG: copper chaperone [Halonotius sp. J07HN6]